MTISWHVYHRANLINKRLSINANTTDNKNNKETRNISLQLQLNLITRTTEAQTTATEITQGSALHTAQDVHHIIKANSVTFNSGLLTQHGAHFDTERQKVYHDKIAITFHLQKETKKNYIPSKLHNQIKHIRCNLPNPGRAGKITF